MGNNTSSEKHYYQHPPIFYRDLKNKIKKRKEIDINNNVYINKKTEHTLFQINKEIYDIEKENEYRKFSNSKDENKQYRYKQNNRNDDKKERKKEKEGKKEKENISVFSDTTEKEQEQEKEKEKEKEEEEEKEQLIPVRIKVRKEDDTSRHIEKLNDNSPYNSIMIPVTTNNIMTTTTNTTIAKQNEIMKSEEKHKKKGKTQKEKEKEKEKECNSEHINNNEKNKEKKQIYNNEIKKKKKEENVEITENKEFNYGFFYMEEKNKSNNTIKKEKKKEKNKSDRHNIMKKRQMKIKVSEIQPHEDRSDIDTLNNNNKNKNKNKNKNNNKLPKKTEDNFNTDGNKSKRNVNIISDIKSNDGDNICENKKTHTSNGPFDSRKNLKNFEHENKSNITTFQCIELEILDDEYCNLNNVKNNEKNDIRINRNKKDNFDEQKKKMNHEQINEKNKKSSKLFNIIKEKKILQNILIFLNCYEILAFQKVCSTIYIYVSDFLDYVCLFIFNKFKKTYSDFFIPFNYSYKYEYLYTERPSYRLDCIIFAQIKPRCVGFNNRLGYRYNYVYDKNRSNYFVYFNFNVLKNNQSRVVKIYKDISYNNGDDINVSHINDNDIYLRDFVCIPINLYNQIGTVNFHSIKFIPNVCSSYIIFKDDIEDQAWYTEKEYKALISEESLTSYEPLTPHLKHLNTKYAGIDVMAVKSTYKAVLSGKLGQKSYSLWGNNFIVKEKEDSIFIFLKREGLLHDYIYHNFYVRVGDDIVFYLIKGGNSY